MPIKIPRTKIAWIDVETTGLDTQKNDVWQIACLIEDRGEVIAAWEGKMRPREEGAIDQEALRLQPGLTKEFLLNLPEPNGVLANFKDFLGKHVGKYNRLDKLVPAGYCVNFDLDFLRAAFEKSGDKYFGSWFFNAPVDVRCFMGLATLTGLRFENYKLVTICKAFGIDLSAHDAMSDITATREVFKIVRGMGGGQ